MPHKCTLYDTIDQYCKFFCVKIVRFKVDFLYHVRFEIIISLLRIIVVDMVCGAADVIIAFLGLLYVELPCNTDICLSVIIYVKL